MRPLLLVGLASRLLLAAAASSPSVASYSELLGRPYTVGYDARALTINGERSMFLSGSLHYPRGAPEEWDGWLDEAVTHGLNMVEIYVFWNLHMPTEEGEGEWSGGANVTQFIARAAAHGLFVYLRVGPYVCAEWTYGGIPLWLAQKDGISFRETNPLWQEAMASFFNAVVERVARAGLFAGQGGPVALVQVENELQPTDREYVDWCGTMAADALRRVGAEGVPLTMCNGETAANAINTCNGEDCVPFLERNGQNGRVLVEQPALWTENEGGFALWGGSSAGEPSYFWGRTPAELAYNSLRWFARGGSLMNYYMFVGGSTRGLWAGSAIATAYATDVNVCHDGLRHGAKSHFLRAMHAALRTAAPALLAQAAAAAQPLAAARLLLPRARANGTLAWATSGAQLGFRYAQIAFVENGAPDRLRVALDALGCAGVQLEVGGSSVTLLELVLAPGPSGACTGATVLFSSEGLPRNSPPPEHREVYRAPGPALRWKAWGEPLADPAALDGSPPSAPAALAGASWQRMARLLASAVSGPRLDSPRDATAPAAAPRSGHRPRRDVGSYGMAVHASEPIEQGLVTRDRTAFASYSRAGTLFRGACAGAGRTQAAGECVLSLEVGRANAVLVLVDGSQVGSAHDLSHEPGTAMLNLSLDVRALGAGQHTLTVVSEHLGYANYGFRTPLVKGLVGAVRLGGEDIRTGAWTIRAGLDGERLRLMAAQGAPNVQWREQQPLPVPGADSARARALHWYRAEFETPRELRAPQAPTPAPYASAASAASASASATATASSVGPQLHLNMSGFGRGHAWVNGHSLGRYWLLARATGPEAGVRPTQALYHVPSAWLSATKTANTVTVLESLGGESVLQALLYIARTAAGPGPSFDPLTWATTISDCEM